MVDFLVLGPAMTVQYRNIFPLIKECKIDIGYKRDRKHILFLVPGKEELADISDTTIWFSNISDYCPAPLEFSKKYIEGDYKKIEGTDIINVDCFRDIPYDYEGVMAVPVTFLRVMNRNQFELIGLKTGVVVDGEQKFVRILIKRK